MKRSLLRERDFRLVAGAVGLSAFGDWVAIVALGLHVTAISDSGFAVAALWVCLFGPSVLVAGHAGLLVDRIETRRLLASASLLGAVVAAVLAFATGTSVSSPARSACRRSATGSRSSRSGSRSRRSRAAACRSPRCGSVCSGRRRC